MVSSAGVENTWILGFLNLVGALNLVILLQGRLKTYLPGYTDRLFKGMCIVHWVWTKRKYLGLVQCIKLWGKFENTIKYKCLYIKNAMELLKTVKICSNLPKFGFRNGHFQNICGVFWILSCWHTFVKDSFCKWIKN